VSATGFKPLKSKVMSLSEAMARFVSDGETVALGLALENMIPFAAGHEIIRQGRRDLTLIGPISDILFDQLIGAGVVKGVKAAWVGNVSTGMGYNFRRAAEGGQIEVVDYSNHSLSLALQAGASGLPCALGLSLMGTELLARNPDLKLTECPFTGRRLLAVRALRPDVAVVHVQRADALGNAHLWGPYGVTAEGVRASRKVIVCCEDLVESEVIRSDPNRTIIPGFLVSAVVVEPFGAHPSGVQGYYGHDDAFYVDYARRTRDAADAREWQREWIEEVADRGEYLKLLGPERIKQLMVSRPAPSAAVDFGY